MKRSKHSPLLEKLLARAADVAGLIRIDERGNVIVTEEDKRRIIEAGADLVHKIVVAESRNKLDEMEAMDDDCSCDDDEEDGKDSSKDAMIDDLEAKNDEEELEPVDHEGGDLDEPVSEDGDEEESELSDDDFKRIGSLLNTDDDSAPPADDEESDDEDMDDEESDDEESDDEESDDEDMDNMSSDDEEEDEDEVDENYKE
jgi:hypothetical protein